MFQKASAPNLFRSGSAGNINNDGPGQGAAKRSSVGAGISSGLFGNSAAPSNLGPMFGSQLSKPAPYGNSNSLAPSSSLGVVSGPTTSLFGGSTAPNNAPSSIFGNSTNKSNISQPGPSSGLFGGVSAVNSSMPAKLSMFGGSAPSQSTFGSAVTSNSNMFPSNHNQQASTQGFSVGIKSNPYDHDRILGLADRPNPHSGMPDPISSSSWLSSSNEKPIGFTRKRSRGEMSAVPEVSHSHPPKHASLLSKLGKTFRIFRFSSKHEKPTIPDTNKGVFSASNYLNAPNTTQHPHGPRFGQTLAPQDPATRAPSAMNRLVVRTKPLKFHLIDANRVLARKLNRVIDYEAVTDDEDFEIDSPPSGKRQKVSMAGQSVRAGDAARFSEELVPKPKTSGRETADGYWCSPSISSIEEMTPEQLKSVNNFIVQRRGYGQIFFRYPVDLTKIVEAALASNVPLSQVLLGDVVKITNKAIKVYQNMVAPLTRDEIGHGLNCPATITLEDIAPPDDDSSTSAFIERLQSCKGQSFVSYDPIGKIWVFTVEHFSVWGLLDDEDEEYAQSAEYRALVDLKRKQDAGEAEARAKSASIYGSAYKRSQATPIAKHEHTESRTEGVPGLWSAAASDPRESPLYTKQDTVAKEIRDQIDLFCQEKSYNGVNLGVSDITIDSDHSDTDVSVVFGESTPPLTADENDLGHLRQLVSLLPRDVDMAEIVDEKAYEPAVEDDNVFKSMLEFSDVPTSTDWLVQLELANDTGSCVNPLLAEPPGAATNFTLSAADEFLFPSYNRETLEQEENTSKSITPSSDVAEANQGLARPKPIESDVTACSQNVPSLMALILDRAEFSIRDNGFPIVKSTNPLTFTMLLGAELSLDERALFNLCSVLFDDHTTTVKEHEEAVRRRQFGEWLVQYNSSMIDGMLAATGENQIQKTFVHLVGGDLANAIASAQKADQGQLAAILTLADANDAVVESIARKQLESWSLTELEKVEPAILHIYQLLAGDLASALVQLPWNAALALDVLYGRTKLTVLEIALQFRKRIPDAGGTAQDRPCAIRQVLSLYADVNERAKEAFSTFTRGCLNPKMAWLIYKVVSGTTITSNSDLDALSNSFGDCLACAGWWAQAAFVYSHISRDDIAKSEIRKLVIDHVGGYGLERPVATLFKAIQYNDGMRMMEQDELMVEDVEIQQHTDELPEANLLIEEYHIPRSLIDEAIAIRRERLEDWWGQCEALIRAELWTQAHSTVVEYLGPEFVIVNAITVRKRLSQLLGRFAARKASICGWKQGAGLYENYLKLVDHESPQAQRDAVDYLMENIPLACDPARFEQGVSLRLMSRRVADAILESTNRPHSEERIMSLKLGQVEREYLKARLAAPSA